jgi:hypothetical protein
LAPQNCINEAAHILVAGIINTFTDFCVVLIPIPVVLKLSLPLRQRILCAILFGAGFIVCIAGGVRIKYTYELNTQYDKTWLFYPTWICGTIELYLGIVSIPPVQLQPPLLAPTPPTLTTIQIATTIPAIKPLIFRYFPNMLGIPTHHASGPLSTTRRTQSPKPRPSNRSTPSPPLSSIDLDVAKLPATTHSDTSLISLSMHLPLCAPEWTQPTTPATGPTDAKGHPFIPQPVISAFSTYRPQVGRESERAGGLLDAHGAACADYAAAWNISHPLPTAPAAFGEARAPPGSLRKSVSSSNVMLARHVRVGSEEVLMEMEIG